MKNIFQKLLANESLIMACLQIYQKPLSLSTFLWVHSTLEEVSHLSWQNIYPNLKTTYQAKMFLVNLNPTYFLKVTKFLVKIS